MTSQAHCIRSLGSVFSLRVQKAQMMGCMRRMETIKFAICHRTEPWMRVHGMG